ncbi:MAG TPA: FAD-dependent oxidoreductase [Pilimelia sp.]|nr:FAD-dependent oxidoreductase [Pilimelia sp.]
MSGTRPAHSRLGHAVVVGGGLAGLAAARVLADRADRVTVLERAAVDAGTGVRGALPQEHHPHVLLHSGQAALEELFPGITAESAGHAAAAFDWGAMTTQLPGQVAGRFRTGIDLRPVPRPALERLVRTRVAAHPRIRTVCGVRVDDLSWSADRRTVTGVRGRSRAGEPVVHAADLVVDASGRHSRLPSWLAGSTGAPVPARTVAVPLCYVSAVHDGPPGAGPGFTAYYEPVYAPMVRRGALVLPLPDRRWLVGLIAVGEPVPVADPERIAFARSLQNPLVAELVATGPRVSPRPHRYLQRSSRWWQYHRIRRWPRGLVALGDAVCTTNPIYGQGMTLAVQQAVALRDILDSHPLHRVPARFQRAVATRLRFPWLLSFNADRGWLPGPRAPGAAAVRGYMQVLLDHAVHDGELFRRLNLVQQLLVPPTGLVAPGTLRALAACVARDRRPRPHVAGRPPAGAGGGGAR